MLQDISPSRMDIAYSAVPPKDGDCILPFDKTGRILFRKDKGLLRFVKYGEMQAADPSYLFSIDGTGYYLSMETNGWAAGYMAANVKELRELHTYKKTDLFAAFTAYHLWKWYDENRFCGKCGGRTAHLGTERALQCTCCGHIIYPRINPAVIIGVIRDDSLLITHYRKGYAHSALVAGFAEIGETLEQTVKREVMEETGIRVKNIRYYKSQPWGMAQDLLTGFFCEADGDDAISMDTNELRSAQWVRKEDIELQPNDLSLTNEMMKVFKEGKIR